MRTIQTVSSNDLDLVGVLFYTHLLRINAFWSFIRNKNVSEGRESSLLTFIHAIDATSDVWSAFKARNVRSKGSINRTIW